MKKMSQSKKTCQTDMNTLQSYHTPNKADLFLIESGKLTKPLNI